MANSLVQDHEFILLCFLRLLRYRLFLLLLLLSLQLLKLILDSGPEQLGLHRQVVLQHLAIRSLGLGWGLKGGRKGGREGGN